MATYLPPYCIKHNIWERGCPDCRLYARERWRQANAGLRPRWVDPGPSVEHMRKLVDAGMSHAMISRMSGVSRATVSKIASPSGCTYVLDRTEAALLAVPIPSRDILLGVARRLQALSAAGWTERDVYRRLGDLNPASPWLRDLRAGKKKGIRPGTWERIAAVYSEMWMSDGGSHRTAAYARKMGWHPPEAWDDSTIDDPTAVPYQHVDHDYVDEVKVKRALAREVPFCDLTVPERVEMVRQWMDQTGLTSMRTFQAHFRPERDAGWMLKRKWLVEAARVLGIEHRLGGRDD